MAKTKGNANVRTFTLGKVKMRLGLGTGNVTWIPKTGASVLTKPQRQKLCEDVYGWLDAYDFFGPHMTKEQKMLATWKGLFGNRTPEGGAK